MPDTIARNAHNDCKGPELTKWNLSISVNDAMPAESNVHVRMNNDSNFFSFLGQIYYYILYIQLVYISRKYTLTYF